MRQGAEGMCKGGTGKMDQGPFAGEGGKEEWRPGGVAGTGKRLAGPDRAVESLSRGAAD